MDAEAPLQHPNPSLPQDLISEILVRLPVKPLLQFKCVSKDWLSLISRREFVNTHLSFNAKDCTSHRLMLQIMSGLKDCSVSRLFSGFSTDSFDLDIPMKTPDDHFHIVGSVNGLLCLYIYTGFERLVLWNPSTRKFKHVPDVMNMPASFDCQKMYGFGYDEVNEDYKVVAVFAGKISACVSIYSLKNDCWRRLDDIPGLVVYDGCPKFVNRKLHWFNVVEGRTIMSIDSTIMSIDMVDEKYGKVEQPPYEEGQRDLRLGVLGNHFSVLCDYYLIRADVWVMKESWIKLYTFKYPNDLPGWLLLLPPIYMSSKGEILHEFGFTLVIYNPENGLTTYPMVTNVDDNEAVSAKLYIESLVSPISAQTLQG